MNRWIALGMMCILLLAGCAEKDNTPESTIGNDPQDQEIQEPNDSTNDEQTPEGEQPIEEEQREEEPLPDVTTPSIPADEAPLPPASLKVVIEDEAAIDPDLVAFLNQLRAAVQSRNPEQLLPLLSEDVMFSFGHEMGKEGFVQYWNLDQSPASSTLWSHVQDALELGGSFVNKEEPRTYFIPYTYLNFPIELDPYLYAAIVGQNVNVRDKPDVSGNVVEKLSLEYVTVTGLPTQNTFDIGGTAYPWLPVVTAKGNTGYVVSKFARSPIDYRLGLHKTGAGDWEIYLLIAGD